MKKAHTEHCSAAVRQALTGLPTWATIKSRAEAGVMIDNALGLTNALRLTDAACSWLQHRITIRLPVCGYLALYRASSLSR